MNAADRPARRIAHQIYGCVYLEEYSLLMESLLKNTAQAMKAPPRGRNPLSAPVCAVSTIITGKACPCRISRAESA